MLASKNKRRATSIPQQPVFDRATESDAPVILETRVVSGTGGGPDKTILKSPSYLWSAGYKTICAYMHPPQDAGFSEIQKKADVYGAPLVSVPDRGPWDWRVFSKMLALCRSERVSIWHGHDYKSNLLGLLINRYWPMRLVTTVHGWVKHTWRTPLYYRIDKACLPRYDAVLCVSDDLRDRSLHCGVSPDRCWLIENAIDTDEFARRADIAVAKQTWKIPHQRFAIGAVGRLSAEKGFDVLIRAVQMLAQRGIDVELLIAGTGDAESVLRSLIAELQLTERVRLLGHVADPRSLFESLDAYVLSSYREGLPNVLLEAMSLETPVIATRVNGVPRVIEHGVSGILIEPGAAKEMADAIGSLASDVEARTRLARAGRQVVVERFGFAERMARVREIYDAILL